MVPFSNAFSVDPVQVACARSSIIIKIIYLIGLHATIGLVI